MSAESSARLWVEVLVVIGGQGVLGCKLLGTWQCLFPLTCLDTGFRLASPLKWNILSDWDEKWGTCGLGERSRCLSPDRTNEHCFDPREGRTGTWIDPPCLFQSCLSHETLSPSLGSSVVLPLLLDHCWLLAVLLFTLMQIVASYTYWESWDGELFGF